MEGLIDAATTFLYVCAVYIVVRTYLEWEGD